MLEDEEDLHQEFLGTVTEDDGGEDTDGRSDEEDEYGSNVHSEIVWAKVEGVTTSRYARRAVKVGSVLHTSGSATL